jgi:hypothetical protein
MIMSPGASKHTASVFRARAEYWSFICAGWAKHSFFATRTIIDERFRSGSGDLALVFHVRRNQEHCGRYP